MGTKEMWRRLAEVATHRRRAAICSEPPIRNAACPAPASPDSRPVIAIPPGTTQRLSASIADGIEVADGIEDFSDVISPRVDIQETVS